MPIPPSGPLAPRTIAGANARSTDNANAKAFEASLRQTGLEEAWTGATGPSRDIGSMSPVAPDATAGAFTLRPYPISGGPPLYRPCAPVALPGAPAPLPGPIARIDAPPAAPASWLGTLTDV